LFDLIEDCLGGLSRVVGAGDGAADYEHGGPVGDGVGWGGYPFLIVSENTLGGAA
jgi:hypothetical protein